MKKSIKNPFERRAQKGASSALCICLLLAGCITSSSCGERAEGDGEMPYELVMYAKVENSAKFSNDVEVKNMDAAFVEFDKDGIEVTQFFPFETDKDGNTIDNIYFYVDSDVTISGCTERVVDIITPPEYTGTFTWDITTIFSIEWEKDWDFWWHSSSLDESETTVLHKKSSGTISNFKWQ